MAPGAAIVNADIWTMEEPSTRTGAMLVERGKVVATGEERRIVAKAKKNGWKITDAGQRTILPGIVDSHTHLVHQGLLEHRVDLRDAPSLDAALAQVRRSLARHPKGELLLAERWDESRWPEKRYPEREELDRLSATTPIILRRVDGHIAVGNRRACELLEGRVEGVDVQSGRLVEEASLNLNQLFPTPLRQSVEALGTAQELALRLGVTTVHDFVVPSYFRAYQELHRRGKLRIRATVSLYLEYLDALVAAGFARDWGDERLRLGGVKLFADGSLGGHTAALHEPYADVPDARGRLNHASGVLAESVATADRAGLVVSAHAIGDAAIDQVTSAFGSTGRSRLRHRVEHFELHTREAEAMLVERGMVASMQPNFVGEWNRPGGMYERRLGRRRSRRLNEFGRLRRAGVRLAFGSDCMPLDPWFGLAGCVNAPFASQRLPMSQAVEAYTRGAAYGIGRERELGWLGPGTFADFVVLPRGWTKDVAATRVDATYVAGRLAYAAPRRRPSS